MKITKMVKAFVLKLCSKVFAPSRMKAFARNDSEVIILTSKDVFQKAQLFLRVIDRHRVLSLPIYKNWGELEEALLNLSERELKIYNSISCLNFFSGSNFFFGDKERVMVSKIAIIRECADEAQLFSRERFIVIFYLKKPDNSLQEHEKVVKLFNFLFDERFELRDMSTLGL